MQTMMKINIEDKDTLLEVEFSEDDLTRIHKKGVDIRFWNNQRLCSIIPDLLLLRNIQPIKEMLQFCQINSSLRVII